MQLRDVLLTAPAGMRERLNAKTLEAKARRPRALRPDSTRMGEPEQAVKYALRELGRRIFNLTAEIKATEKHITKLVEAAQMLITAGRNIDRFPSEAAFARLCGVALIPVSSGKRTE